MKSDALRELIDSVEAGAANHSDFSALFPYPICDHAREAHLGSLDAAKRLHESLLPWWIFDLTNRSCFVFQDEESSPQYMGESDIWARAWLIAILKAYEART